MAFHAPLLGRIVINKSTGWFARHSCAPAQGSIRMWSVRSATYLRTDSAKSRATNAGGAEVGSGMRAWSARGRRGSCQPGGAGGSFGAVRLPMIILTIGVKSACAGSQA